MAETVEALSTNEQQWIRESEQHALRLIRNYLGDKLSLSHSEADLQQIQFMIDDGEFDPKTSVDLYAFGVILGNVFNAHTSMKWAAVTNEFGRNIAVHDRSMGFTLYPIQMIHKRIHDGREVKVVELYRSFVRDLNLAT